MKSITDSRTASSATVFDDGAAVELFDGDTLALDLADVPVGELVVTDRRGGPVGQIAVDGRTVRRAQRGSYFGPGKQRWRVEYHPESRAEAVNTDS